MEVSGAEAFLNAVVAESVDFAFGIPGTHILPIIELLEESPLNFVNVRHEAGAAAMADTYGRLTGRPGVCLVTAGPGATNSLTGVAHAFAAASPMLHVSGTVPTTSGTGAFHGADKPRFLESVFAPVCKRSCSLGSVAEIPRVVHTCFQEATTGRRGPVHLGLPLDLLLARGVTAKPSQRVKPIRAVRNLARTAKILSSAARPVILVGEEARGLGREVEIFAEKLQSPVISTMNALGVFPQENHLFVGYVEQFWRLHPTAFDVVKEADLVVSIGARAASPETNCITSVVDTEWLFLTEEAPGEKAKKAEYVSGDIRRSLVALGNKLEPAPKLRENWSHKAVAGLRSYMEELDRNAAEKSRIRPIHPAYAAHSLLQFLPRDGVVCSDSGANEIWVREYLGNRRNCEYLYSGTFGGMGFSLPAAIAASLLRPNTRILAVSGDGGLLMSLMELSTLVEQKSNAVIVVFNDSAYGMMWLLQHHKTTNLLNPVNFAKVAEGFGVKSWRVEEPGKLKDSLSEAFSVRGPALVDVIVDHKQPLPFEPWMERFRQQHPEV
ncbi:MAG: thiamine pyrophosphate-binding protein [Candidatus Bathyarchaeia archaeon]|jgi:acetolactate synthase-1/2/3 large subunit